MKIPIAIIKKAIHYQFKIGEDGTQYLFDLIRSLFIPAVQKIAKQVGHSNAFFNDQEWILVYRDIQNTLKDDSDEPEEREYPADKRFRLSVKDVVTGALYDKDNMVITSLESSGFLSRAEVFDALYRKVPERTGEVVKCVLITNNNKMLSFKRTIPKP